MQYQFDVHLPHREPSALYDGALEAVWDERVWHHTVTGCVATRDYNYRYAAPYREAGVDSTPEPEIESGAFYARIQHERALNHAIRMHLFSNGYGRGPPGN